MSRPRVWDTDLLRALADEGLTVAQMAGRIGCDERVLRAALSRHGIRAARQRSGLAGGPRDYSRPRAPAPATPCARKTPRGLAGAEADIFMAGPSWAGLARAAARHGISTAEAQRIWHRVRGMA